MRTRTKCSPACALWGSYGHIDGTEDMPTFPHWLSTRPASTSRGIHHYGNYRKGVRKVARANVEQLQGLGWVKVGESSTPGPSGYVYMKPPVGAS